MAEENQNEKTVYTAAELAAKMNEEMGYTDPDTDRYLTEERIAALFGKHSAFRVSAEGMTAAISANKQTQGSLADTDIYFKALVGELAFLKHLAPRVEKGENASDFIPINVEACKKARIDF